MIYMLFIILLKIQIVLEKTKCKAKEEKIYIVFINIHCINSNHEDKMFSTWTRYG